MEQVKDKFLSKNTTHWGFVLYEFDKNQWMASFTKMISWDATFDFFYICIQILNYVALQSSTKHCGLKVEKLSKDKKKYYWFQNPFMHDPQAIEMK